MKSWVYLLLIGFIAVAAYKFGYYQKLLAVSDKDKQRILARLQDKAEPEPAQVTALAAVTPPATVTAATSTVTAPDADSETRVKDFFTLHPNAQSLLLHSVRCTVEGCDMTGQFDGQLTDFDLMVEQLEHQPWWRYGKASQKNATNTAKGKTTYFVLRYRAVVNS